MHARLPSYYEDLKLPESERLLKRARGAKRSAELARNSTWMGDVPPSVMHEEEASLLLDAAIRARKAEQTAARKAKRPVPDDLTVDDLDEGAVLAKRLGKELGAKIADALKGSQENA